MAQNLHKVEDKLVLVLSVDIFCTLECYYDVLEVLHPRRGAPYVNGYFNLIDF